MDPLIPSRRHIPTSPCSPKSPTMAMPTAEYICGLARTCCGDESDAFKETALQTWTVLRQFGNHLSSAGTT